jgi:hypothetical protein
VVLLSPFLDLAVAGGLVRALAPVVSWLVPVVPKLSRRHINDPKGYSEYETGSSFVSLRAYRHLANLGERARAAALSNLLSEEPVHLSICLA